MERSSRGSRRRTSRIETYTHGVWVAILCRSRTIVLGGIWWWQSRGVRLVVGALATRLGRRTLQLRNAGLLLWWLLVHGLLRIARWWRRVLSGLLLWWRILLLFAVTVAMGQRLAVRAVELRIRWRILAAPDSVRRNKSLCLSTDWREDTFLREALTVGAAAILRLVEAGTANLDTARQYVYTLIIRTITAYLASSAVSAGDRSALTRGRLRGWVRHLLLIRRCVHLRRRRQCAILVGMLRLEGLHGGPSLRHRLRNWRDLIFEAVSYTHLTLPTKRIV